MNMHSPDVAQRAALYLRVSTTRQAEHDVSIPDQRKQGEAYCASRGYRLIETFVEAGASATNDRRPEFQRMIEAGTSKPAPFDVVVVHSFIPASEMAVATHNRNWIIFTVEGGHVWSFRETAYSPSSLLRLEM